jgi:hypothetical protein
MFHENPLKNSEYDAASPRGFGLTFAVVFLAIGVLPLFRHGQLRIWSLVVGFIFLVIALTLPGSLRPLSRLWSLTGSLLGRVMTPLLMGIVFVLAVIPVALLRRVTRNSGLALRFDPKLESYWIARDPVVTDTESLKRQF